MTITVNATITVQVHSLPPATVDLISGGITSLLERIGTMSAALDKLVQEVQEQQTVISSAIALMQGLKAALDAAGTDEAKLAELSASLDGMQSQLAAAVAANTPGGAPAPVEPPPAG